MGSIELPASVENRNCCIKITKTSPPDANFELEMHKNVFVARALPWTPTGELTAFPWAPDPVAGLRATNRFVAQKRS